MKILIASIDPAELKAARDFGVQGIITNPSVVSDIKKPWRKSIGEAAQIIKDGSFHLQLTQDDDRLNGEKQVKDFYEVIGDRLVVKACINQEMLSLIPVIKRMQLKVNITGIVTLAQAYVAVQAGADYVSIYLGRAENAGINSLDIIKKLYKYIQREGFESKIIAASLKGVSHFTQATDAGAHYAACPYSLLPQLIKHNVTDISIESFRKDWESIPE